jgi:hypothetical protein
MQTTRRRGRLVRAAIALALFAGTAQAAEMTLFLQPQFQGRQATLRGESTNLSSIGFTDQVSSLVVHSGRWQVCTQPNFQGECMTLGPGEYPALDSRLNHRIESARLIGDDRPRISEGYGYGAEQRHGDRYSSNGGYDNASIELFAGRDFRGSSITLDRSAAFLAETGFDNRAASVIVNEGTWQLCTEPRFHGDCRTFGPGRYGELFGMTKDVSSVRRVG